VDGGLYPKELTLREDFDFEELEWKEALRSKNTIFSGQRNKRILNLLFYYLMISMNKN